MILRTSRDIGALIRQTRKDADIDQATLAEKVGVSRWWINAIERGKPRAELDLVLRTLAVLGIKITTVDSAGTRNSEISKPTPGDVLARAREDSR